MNSETYDLRHFRRLYKNHLGITQCERAWVEHKVFGCRLTPMAKRWIKYRKGKPTERVLRAVELAQGVKDEIAESRKLLGPCVVYYASNNTGLVKIGVTRQLEKRMYDLRCYGGDMKVLATEPGSCEIEKARHKQFAKDRAFGEWFRESPELSAWIKRLAA